MNKQVHNRWVAASKMNEHGAGEAFVSSGAFLKAGPWDQDIAELQRFFSVIELPTEPIRIDKCSTITDINIFLKSHFDIVKKQNGNKRFTPYMDRLILLRSLLYKN